MNVRSFLHQQKGKGTEVGDRSQVTPLRTYACTQSLRCGGGWVVIILKGASALAKDGHATWEATYAAANFWYLQMAICNKRRVLSTPGRILQIPTVGYVRTT